MRDKKIVVKIGSNILAKDSMSFIEWLAHSLKKIISVGYFPVIVTSGAIAAGKLSRGISKATQSLSLNEKQALAAIGQPILMSGYKEIFLKNDLEVAQVLITRGDFMSRTRFSNIRSTLLALIEYGVIPVINENDTVATDEIKFGDNDELSAIVAAKIGAEKLILLTDVDGLYRGEFRKENLVRVVEKITPDIKKLASKRNGAGTPPGGGITRISEHGSGGMISKIRAAEIATAAGIMTIITRPPDFKDKDFFVRAVSVKDGKDYALIDGTVFLPAPFYNNNEMTSGGLKAGVKGKTRRRGFDAKGCWIAFGAKPHGSIVVDRGAARAIAEGGKSLLASGVTAVEGEFSKGDVVSIKSILASKNMSHLEEIGRGIVNYSSGELSKIKGMRSTEIPRILHNNGATKEVIHRDNLVILKTLL